MTFEEYITPDLLVLIPVLYVIGSALKRFERFKDKHIPIMLGGVGIAIALLYECSVLGCTWDAFYAAVVQGVLCAGASVYVNQAYKQMKKE